MFWIDRSECLKCNICLNNCPIQGAIKIDKDGYPYIDNNICSECGICINVCPRNAIKINTNSIKKKNDLNKIDVSDNNFDKSFNMHNFQMNNGQKGFWNHNRYGRRMGRGLGRGPGRGMRLGRGRGRRGLHNQRKGFKQWGGL